MKTVIFVCIISLFLQSCGKKSEPEYKSKFNQKIYIIL
jgi:hypothetical protein